MYRDGRVISNSKRSWYVPQCPPCSYSARDDADFDDYSVFWIRGVYHGYNWTITYSCRDSIRVENLSRYTSTLHNYQDDVFGVFTIKTVCQSCLWIKNMPARVHSCLV